MPVWVMYTAFCASTWSVPEVFRYGRRLGVAVEELSVEHLQPDFLVANFVRLIESYADPKPAVLIPFLGVFFQVAVLPSSCEWIRPSEENSQGSAY